MSSRALRAVAAAPVARIAAAVDLSGRRVLVISPRFFGYETRIISHLEARGATATWFDERPSNATWAKALIRMSPSRMAPIAERHYAEILAKLQGADFDDVLFISPEACTRSTLRRFRAQFGAARFLLYMWDSFENKGRRDPGTFVELFDRALTFDPDDAERYGMLFRSLFYCEQKRLSEAAEPELALSFIGTIHSDRYRIVKALCRDMDEAGMRYFVYPYLASRLLYWGYRASKPEFHGTSIADFRYEPMPYPEVLAIMANSAAVLDIEHPRQRGITMRTLEVIASGQKLVTTNARVKSYPFYSEQRIWVLDRTAPRVDQGFFRGRAGALSATFEAKYSLAGWTADVFGQKQV